MKYLFFIILLFFSSILIDQKLEIVGGLNSNRFYDLKIDEGHFRSTYFSEYGYNLELGIEDIKVHGMKMRFALGYDTYSGRINVRGGGNGGGHETIGESRRSIISLGVFPINLNILNQVNLNFGFEMSHIITSSAVGEKVHWAGGDYNKNELSENFNSKLSFGLKGRLAYDFVISNKIVISPQYAYYLGLLKEFSGYPEFTKSMRHYFGVGIQKVLQ